MPNNLEIEIFIFLVRCIIVVLLGLLAFTCDKMFPQYMCLTLITIHCLVCCRSPNQKPGQTPRPAVTPTRDADRDADQDAKDAKDAKDVEDAAEATL